MNILTVNDENSQLFILLYLHRLLAAFKHTWGVSTNLCTEMYRDSSNPIHHGRAKMTSRRGQYLGLATQTAGCRGGQRYVPAAGRPSNCIT
jgi:hypothetical protein